MCWHGATASSPILLRHLLFFCVCLHLQRFSLSHVSCPAASRTTRLIPVVLYSRSASHMSRCISGRSLESWMRLFLPYFCFPLTVGSRQAWLAFYQGG
ncbi:hypothetical protein HDK64DRAFT_142479 [Phyllosticta capitalensis]